MSLLVEKFYARLWTLRFLKRSGLDQSKLLNVYNSVIKPAIEYSSVVYHTMISKELSDKLEGMQRQAMRIILGHEGDIRQKMDNKGVELLADRREEAILRFALKSENNPRYGHKWFTPTQQGDRSVRATTRSKYVEKRCRTERLQNNPINYMTKKLNEHYRL